jgi:hypothetical protein
VWTQSWEGRHAVDDQYEAKWRAMVPNRAWHGASSSELAILQMAVDLAPGGPWGAGISRFDPNNRAAVLAAVAEVVEGRHLQRSESGASAGRQEPSTPTSIGGPSQNGSRGLRGR